MTQQLKHSNEPHQAISGKSQSSAFGRFAHDRHKRVARCVGYCLANCDYLAMSQLRAVLRARLNTGEVAALAWSALGALDPEQAHETSATVLGFYGMPLPPLSGAMDEATHWAGSAPVDELRAYCLACYNRMHPTDQKDFRDFIAERDAA